MAVSIRKIAEDVFYESIVMYTETGTDSDDSNEMITAIENGIKKALLQKAKCENDNGFTEHD